MVLKHLRPMTQPGPDSRPSWSRRRVLGRLLGLTAAALVSPGLMGRERRDSGRAETYRRVAKVYRREIDDNRLREIVKRYGRRRFRSLDRHGLNKALRADFVYGRTLTIRGVTVSETEIGYLLSRTQSVR